MAITTKIEADNIDVTRYKTLVNAPDKFYASELDIPFMCAGGVINGWQKKHLIQWTGNTRETWIQINEDTKKLCEVKEWQKTAFCKEKFPQVVELLDKAMQILRDYKEKEI